MATDKHLNWKEAAREAYAASKQQEEAKAAHDAQEWRDRTRRAVEKTLGVTVTDAMISRPGSQTVVTVDGVEFVAESGLDTGAMSILYHCPKCGQTQHVPATGLAEIGRFLAKRDEDGRYRDHRCPNPPTDPSTPDQRLVSALREALHLH